MQRESLQRRFSSRKPLRHAFSGNELIMTLDRYFGSAPDEEAVARHLSNLESKLDAYEVILAKQKYLAGDVSYSRGPITSSF